MIHAICYYMHSLLQLKKVFLQDLRNDSIDKFTQQNLCYDSSALTHTQTSQVMAHASIQRLNQDTCNPIENLDWLTVRNLSRKLTFVH